MLVELVPLIVVLFLVSPQNVAYYFPPDKSLDLVSFGHPGYYDSGIHALNITEIA